MKVWFSALLWMLCALADHAADVFPAVEVARPETGQQQRLRRALSLLNRSRLDRTNVVRIAFYGQSFGQPVWWTNLVGSIQKAYPFAMIVAENRGLDRHPSPELIRYAEARLIPFRPDLVVLMTMGDHHETRRLVRLIRERTSADVLLMTEPFRMGDRMDEPTQAGDFKPEPKYFKPTAETWHPFLNYGWLPFVAEDLQVALLDIRTGWKNYLQGNHLEASSLMIDNVRFTPQGHMVMEELIKPWFEFSPWMTAEDPWDGERVSTYEIPRDVQWKAGGLKLELVGNRVEVIVESPLSKSVPVRLDGRVPSELLNLRVHDAATFLDGTTLPVLLEVGKAAPLLKEEWVVRVTDVSTNGGRVHFRFTVQGSVTGPDGEGVSDVEFLSKSHRVVIHPKAWNLEYILRQFRVRLPESFEVRWSVLDLGRDDLKGAGEMGGTGQWVATVATDLEPGRHTLELVDRETQGAGIMGIRVYRPALKAEPKRRP